MNETSQELMYKAEARAFFQGIWDMFAEADKRADKRAQETERQRKETERQLKEAKLETERQRKETERISQETQLKFQETERLMKESSREVDKQMKALQKQMGEFGNRLGEFVEEMVEPAVLRLFQERGIYLNQVFPNVKKRDENKRLLMEIDLLLVDTDTAVLVECKSRCSEKDVEKHLERLASFKHHFSQYADYRIYGAVAAMVIPDNVAELARNGGLYILGQSGDAIAIQNDDDFCPRVW